MSSQDPLNYPTCEELDAGWGGSLLQSWKNCTDPTSKDWAWMQGRQYTPGQKTKIINAACCGEIMQCSNPVKWLRARGVYYHCASAPTPDEPHFGMIPQDVRGTVRASLKRKYNAKAVRELMHGVY